MNTIPRSFMWIALILALLILELQTFGIAQVKENALTPGIVALSVKASFDQGDKDLRYFSYWSGKIFCQCKQPKKSDESLEVCFPLGLGEIPSSLYMRWTTTSKNKKTKSTDPVFISLVKYKAEPSEVMAWTQMKELNDPSLTISMAASTGKDKEYTNEDEVEGRIVVWLRDKKGTTCLPLAQVRIPERSILLKYSSDKNGEPSTELTIQSMRIIDFEDDTWDLIIKSGNRHLNLPTDPEDAECRSFTARNDIEQTEGRQSTSNLQCALLQAYRTGDINADDMKKLIGYMDGYKISEINTDYSQISRNQMQCQKLMNDLVKSGKIKSQNAKSILELSKKIFTSTFSSARSLGHRVPPPSHTAAGPEVTYYVRPGSVKSIAGFEKKQVHIDYRPDGTIELPYRTIAQAYDAAKAVDSRRVEIIVDGGFYDEQLNLDRNTILTAAPGSRPIIGSTIVCTRALRLEMTGFTLLGAPSPGALQVLVPGSSIYLVDVEISEAHRYGIYQRGGELNLRSVTIHDTRREAGQMEYGSGIVLQDGIRAFLATVTLYENESSGIILRGRDSYLAGLDVTLRRNKLHTDFYSEAAHNIELPIGTFLVNDQAAANLIRLHMHENEFCGLGVYNNAEVSVDNAIINYNRYIHLAEEDLTEEDRGFGRTNDWGGIGIRAKNGGHITMRNFLISDNDLLGIGLHNLGKIDLHIGDVCRNVIGVNIAGVHGETYIIERLMDDVRYFDNERNLDSEYLPVPGSGIPD